MVYVLCFILFLIGVYSIVSKRNLIKIIIGLVIIEHAVNLMLILVCYKLNGVAPILQPGMSISEFIKSAVDPLPQALVVTSIVIGFGTIALAVSLCIRLYDKYQTFDISKIRSLRG